MTLSSLAELREVAGDRDGASAAVTEAMELVRGLGVHDDLAHLLVRRSTYLARSGRLDEARADLARAEEVSGFETGWHPLVDAGLGEVARRAGDPAEARRCFQRGLDLGRARPYLPGQVEAMLLTGLAYTAIDEGDHATAGPLLDEAAATAHRSHDMPILTAVIDAMAAAALAAGDPGRAALLLGVADRLRGSPERGNPDVVHAVETARAALGPAAYDERYAAGAAMERDEALAVLGVTPGGGTA
jgi:ATP/maltotriose-dependent transcriptional regulator MalT